MDLQGSGKACQDTVRHIGFWALALGCRFEGLSLQNYRAAHFRNAPKVRSRSANRLESRIEETKTGLMTSGSINEKENTHTHTHTHAHTHTHTQIEMMSPCYLALLSFGSFRHDLQYLTPHVV